MRRTGQLCLVCGWTLVLTAVLSAAPLMDLTFVYQGRLYDANSPADGLYDLEFTLVDASDPEDPISLSYPERLAEHFISNGYITVPLNFYPWITYEEKELFDGSDRWLKIGIRPGEMEDPNNYTYLKPFTKITAAPYALLAHRLEPPATLQAELDEPVLHVINEGTGPAISSGGNLYLYEYDATGVSENTIQFEGSGTLNFSYDMDIEVGHNRQTVIGASDSTQVSVNSTAVIGNDRNTTIGVDDQTTVGATSTVSSTFDLNRTAGRDLNLQANENMVLQAGEEIQAAGPMRIAGDDPNEPEWPLLVDRALYLKRIEQPDLKSGYGVVYVYGDDLYYKYKSYPSKLNVYRPSPEYFTVRRDTTYDWPSNGSPAVIDFTTGTTVLENWGGGFDSKSGAFIVPRPGMYTFDGSAVFSGLSKGDQLYVEIVAAGRAYRGDMETAQSPERILQAHITVNLYTGDVVYLQGYINAASPPAQVVGSSTMLTYFNGARVDYYSY